METITLKVTGMFCEGCAGSVTRVLSRVAGVQQAKVDLDKEQATVSFDPGQAKLDDMKQAIRGAGYNTP